MSAAEIAGAFGAETAETDFDPETAGRVIFVGLLLPLSLSEGRLLAVTRLIAVFAEREAAVLFALVDAVVGFERSV